MNNISCQQLTDDLSHLLKLKKECANLPTEKKVIIEKLQELKSFSTEVMSHCLVEIELWNGEKLKVNYLDYKSFEEFKQKNDDLKIALSKDNLDEDHCISYLNIAEATVLCMNPLKKLKKLREVRFYATKIIVPEDIVNLADVKVLTFFYSSDNCYKFLKQLPLLEELTISGGDTEEALAIAEIPNLRSIHFLDSDRKSPYYKKLSDRLKSRGIEVD